MKKEQAKVSLVQKHMRTVIIVFALIVSINIAVMSRFFLTKKPTKTNPLWDYVSDTVQQAVLVQSDVLIALLGNEIGSVSNNPLYSTLIDSNYIWILQFWSGLINQSSAILLHPKKSFSSETFLSMINMQDSTDYTFHRYNDGVYVFGQPSTIDMMLSDNYRSIKTSPRFSIIGPLLKGWHIHFLSRVNPNASDDPTIATFVSQTDMFLLHLEAKKRWVQLHAHLLYTQAKEKQNTSIFKPTMTRYINEQTIAYIETSLDWLFSQGEKWAAIDAIRNYDPALFATLDDTQIAWLTTNNIGLIAQNSPTFDALRLALLLDNPDAFAIVGRIFPSLQEPLAALAWLDPELLTAKQEPDRLSYTATLFGLVPLTLQSYVDKDTTIVSLGTESLLASPNIHNTKQRKEDSIGYVFVQFDPLLQLYRQLTTMAGSSVQDPFLLQQEKLLQGRTWAWYLSADEHKVSLWSEIQ